MTFIASVRAPALLAGSTRWFVVHAKGIVRHLADDATSETYRAWLTQAEAEGLGLDLASAHYLGRHAEEDCFVVGIGTSPPSPFHVESLFGLIGRLDDLDFAIASRAVQVAGWAETHRFCGRCGAPTELHEAERCLGCPRCGLVVYPRITPAIIVLVRRDERALLARSGRVQLPFYSTLAGFVEAGETLEETLHREVHEEVGLTVTNLRYFGSQSWPFPNSLMVGYFADWAAGEITIDGEEIADAQWFSHDELPKIPPRQSIARGLIDHWVSEVSGR